MEVRVDVALAAVQRTFEAADPAGCCWTP
jgi:hypothetical protein